MNVIAFLEKAFIDVLSANLATDGKQISTSVNGFGWEMLSHQNPINLDDSIFHAMDTCTLNVLGYYLFQQGVQLPLRISCQQKHSLKAQS